MPRLCFALLLPLLCAVCAAQAQVYTWVDADGQKHFGSMPPTPEQAVQPVEIRASSPGNTQPAPTPEAAPTSVADTAASTSSQANQAESSPHVPTRKMCGEAVRWTGIDLPNLKEIALERRRQGRINQSQYQQAMKALDQVKAEVTVPNCLASKDKDQRRYECLAQGLGIAICSGALSEALNKL